MSSWRARRARPGFNEDRRICPIKTSYKDPSGSALIRKTSNLDFAATAASYPRATLQVPAYRYPSRYRYRATPSKPSRDFEQRQSRRWGFMEVVPRTVGIRERRSDDERFCVTSAIDGLLKVTNTGRSHDITYNEHYSALFIRCTNRFNEF